MFPARNNPCSRWECYESRVWAWFWKIMFWLMAILLGIAAPLCTGCAFSIPINDRIRCDIQIDAQLTSTEPLPTIWTDK